MFYYISFLRPPPLQASTTPNEPILITPQICNDLRTEYLDDPIDIYFAWFLHGHTPPTTTKLTKLTSWRSSTAYKEIAVPGPPHFDGQHSSWGEADGSSWRLVLACGTTPSDRAMVLGETNTTGKTPFGVMSLPIRFPRRRGTGNKSAGTGASKGTKQERIVRSYVLRIPLRDNPIAFDITEQTSFDLDKKIWDGGIGLSSWLVQLFSGDCTETDRTVCDLRQSLFGTDARHILELGAGTGIVAVTLAILRSTLDFSDKPGSIFTTDLPSAMPILRDNIASNHGLMTKCVPQAAVLDWENEEIPPPVQDQLEIGLDVIVMADVAYNTSSFSALIGTLSLLIQRCKRDPDRRPPRVLMGYKERHSDERSLWDRTKDIGIHFQQIARVDGAGGNPVEIWLGCAGE